jgi:hypothetical protein
MQQPFAYISTTEDKLQKQSVSKALSNLLEDNTVRNTIEWERDRLSVIRTPGSSFDHLHRPAALLLVNIIKHPAFLDIRQAQSIPLNVVFQVDEQARIFYTHENVRAQSGVADPQSWNATGFFTRTEIALAQVSAAGFSEDLRLLAISAKSTGGWVSSGQSISVDQWLRFNKFPLPVSEEGSKELIDLLNFSTLPEPPRHANYWQLFESPEASPFQLNKENRAVIRQVNERATANEISLIEAYGTSLIIESGSPDGLPDSPGYRLRRLIDDILRTTEQAKEYIDALGWFKQATDAPPTPEFVEQLIFAAILLDLDAEADITATAFAGYDLYSSRHMLNPPGTVRRELEEHLISQRGLNKVIAPLVAELVLAGMAPEYLVNDAPAQLKIATPGWVVLSQAVHFAETISPGISRSMTYEHLLGFARFSKLTPELQAAHDQIAVDPIMTWALMNKLATREADGSLSEVTVLQASAEYRRYVDQILQASIQLREKLPHRRPLALEEMRKEVPDCDPDELLVKHRGTGGGNGRKVSVVDLYMGDELNSEDWDRINGTSIYQSFPNLLSLYPANDLYEEAISRYAQQMQAAMECNINVAFSQLRPRDRGFIENAHLAIYCVQQFTRPHYPTLPTPGGITPVRPAVAGDTGRFGIIICAVIQAEVRCYELFPLKSQCRLSEKLTSVFTALVKPDGLDNATDFTSREQFDDLPIDITAYLSNSEPRTTQSKAFIRKVGEFKESWEDTDGRSTPNRFFRSSRKEAISELIAKEIPAFTAAELWQMGLDQTQREKAIATTETIFNTLINVIIPFKECVEELSSGDNSRQIKAINGCVMDVIGVAAVVAALPLKIAGTALKATTTAAKLLSGSKVIALTIVNLFNPLDGLPKLLQGGGKLIGRSLKRLGTHASAIPHAAREQLRLLTGANRYDLIKAINHTDSASRIRMSLDTVAHARALFKDDSIETIQHVVTRLSDKSAALHKGTSSIELDHLFNNAVREASLHYPSVTKLQSLIGTEAVENLLHSYMQARNIRHGDTFTTAKYYAETLDFIAELEIKKVGYMTGYQQNVLKTNLDKAPYTDVMPEAAFNFQGHTEHSKRAAAWMLNGSSSKENDFDNILAVLREYTGNNKSLTDPAVITEVHRRLVPSASGVIRDAGAETLYGSSVTGFALLEQHLKTLDTTHQHFDKHLLAAIVGFQGFGDGNGRTASAMYAISQLRNDSFTPMTPAAFRVLNGIF